MFHACDLADTDSLPVQIYSYSGDFLDHQQKIATGAEAGKAIGIL